MRNPSFSEGSILIDGVYNDIIHYRHKFGTVGVGSSIIQQKEYKGFHLGVGEVDENISTGSSVRLTRADCSMEGIGGFMPNSDEFWIHAIGIHVELASIRATTPDTDNSVASIDVTPVDTVSPIPLQQAIMSQATFELYRNSSEKIEEGTFPEYPCQFGSQGFAGGGDAGGAGEKNGVQFISSQGMVFRRLTAIQKLKKLDQFFTITRFGKQIDLADTLLTGHIDYYLVGVIYREDETPVSLRSLGYD